jgi:hypothetical protein
MEKEQNTILNYGILASISWNSNNWADNPSEEDLKASKYDYVKDKAHMHESLNFGHDIFPVEEDGYYIGYTPMFNRPPDLANSKNVEIVFFTSSDYRNSNRKTVIGFYGFPTFGEWFKREAEHPLFKTYDSGNIMALPEHIIYFQNPIIINNETVQANNLLPEGKKISQQGFNYLHSDNVYNLIKLALTLNPKNDKLKKFVDKFPLIEKLAKEEFDLQDFIEVIGESTADNLKDIVDLENKMKKQHPEIKKRISSFIERGAIANKVKKLNNFKCSVCESFAQTTNSFTKRNGDTYIETHHVEPVSTFKVGVLSVTNLMTVCANHHRQLHYGNVELIDNGSHHFTFKIDERVVIIDKINISQH